jgi:excinuclease ABC subunit A
VAQGKLDDLLADDKSLTGAYLSGKRQIAHRQDRRRAQGWLKIEGATGHNLKDLSVGFPLGVFCVVTGVSGAGKSTLVHDTLYATLCRHKQKLGPKPLPTRSLIGSEFVDDVVWIDSLSPGQTARSNPVTYVKAFTEIRRVFAETVDARIHNYTPGHFSFNVEGGRCEECKGEGSLTIDMQFLSDVRMTCPLCRGRRFRDTILEVTYRGKNIYETLEMTIREAFRFFRGEKKVQSKLQRLMDVGLDYLRLGQPLDTLSSGEAQRLKLAEQLAVNRRRHTLFLLEEPASGLHFADIVKLLDCFDSLIAVGHSLIVAEHNLRLIEAADYVIDLGPGPADKGGELIACGTPEEVAGVKNSLTGKHLAKLTSS